MEQNGLKTVIIDPASTEFNRGSFCYLPYIYHNAIQPKLFMENFTVADIDDIKDIHDVEYHVALWSYPQIDTCLILNRFLPGVKKFFGYTPLIKQLRLPLLELDDETIFKGMVEYPNNYYQFDYLLLSDCDMHLKEYEGQVYPLFTSYGCPRGCAFCPSTVNCGRKRIVIPTGDVSYMLSRCAAKKVKNIHFTDEDFFFDIDRAKLILGYTKEYEMHLIALAEVDSLARFITKYGNRPLIDGGMKLIEVGLETADAELGKKMGKHPVSHCLELEKLCEVPIFWLTLTFFPGETLKTLNTTGDFLRKHGFRPEELYGRIRTNGTEGGLGQFFQPYHGTKNYEMLKHQGRFLSSRPVRLIPSFIPFSFLEDKIQYEEEHVPFVREEAEKWFDLYNLEWVCFMDIRKGTVRENIKMLVQKYDMSVADAATGIAILARLNII